MIRVGSTRGFTIIETIIVLATTSGLFVGAMLMMSGQQARTEFRQAVNDTRAQVDDAANDVATGYYTFNGNLTCANTSFSALASEQGTSVSCIAIGRAVQFLNSPAGTLNVYTVVGKRLNSSGSLSTSLVDSGATIATAGGTYDQPKLPSGTTIYRAFYIDSTGAKKDVLGFAIVSSLAKYSGANLVSGSASADLMPIEGSGAATIGAFRTALINTFASAVAVKNPSSGVTVCIDSGGTTQHGVLTIGAGGSLASTLDIKDGKSSTDGACT